MNPALDPSPNRADAIDPVCGMTVDPEVATSRNLHSKHDGLDYYFCGRGCKLDFDEDPEHHLGADHRPSM